MLFNFIKKILQSKKEEPNKNNGSISYMDYPKSYSSENTALKYLKGKKAIQKSFVVFDIETTGLSATEHEIIEIGAIRVNDIKASSHTTFHALIKPTCKLPRQITQITGITDKMLEECLGIEAHIHEFKKFIGDLPVIAHNASFDCRFICEAFETHGIEFNNNVIDTLQLTRKAFPNLENHKLITLKKHINIKTDKEHRAMDDAISTLRIYALAISTLHGDVW